MTAATDALALHGGAPVRTCPAAAPAVGDAEARAVAEVMASGVLSQFVGVWGDFFAGGPRVRAIEVRGRSASASATRSR